MRLPVLSALLIAVGLTGVAPPEAAALGEATRKSAFSAVLAGRATPGMLENLEALARQGDGEAADLLAFVYAKGKGVKPDLPRAFRWYLAAGLAGRSGAMPNAVLVWRAMPGDDQREAETLMTKGFTAEQIATLRASWSDAAGQLDAAAEEGKRAIKPRR